MTPSLSSFPESIQEEASTTLESFIPINQSRLIVAPGNVKTSPIDSSPTATVLCQTQQDSAQSIHHRPVSLNIHKCPAHYHTTAQGNMVSPFHNWPKCVRITVINNKIEMNLNLSIHSCYFTYCVPLLIL